jgi:hypothetical protein
VQPFPLANVNAMVNGPLTPAHLEHLTPCEDAVLPPRQMGGNDVDLSQERSPLLHSAFVAHISCG